MMMVQLTTLYSLIGWPYCHPSAVPRAVKHPTKPGIKTKNDRQTDKQSKKSKEGAIKCCKKISSPTLKYEWCNIPFDVEIEDLHIVKYSCCMHFLWCT